MQELQFNDNVPAALAEQETPDDGDAAQIRDALYNLIAAIKAEPDRKVRRELKREAAKFIFEL